MMKMAEAQALTGEGLHIEVLRLFDSANIGKKAKILDSGCGEGALLEKIGGKGYKNLSGCDINDRDLKFRKITFKKCDLNKGLPYPDKSFDVVFSIESIEHLENPWNLINEFHRVLKPGGTLILSTPNLHNWYQRLFFLLKGSFNGFETDPKKRYHIFPAFVWTLQKMVEGKFNIREFGFGRSIVPILRIKLPVRGFFFSECYIVRMQKK